MSWYPINPTKGCVYENEAGYSYENLACLYNTTIGQTYTKFEYDYDPVYIRDKMVANPWIPIAAVTLYAIGIVYGRNYYFVNKPAWNWRQSMAAWNLFLSVFSTIGFLRCLPQLLHNLLNYTLTENLCLDPESHYGSGPTGFWVQLFCLSKFPYVYSCRKCFLAGIFSSEKKEN